MRIPNRESVALFLGVQRAKTIHVVCVFDNLDGLALNVAAAQPDEGPDPCGHATGIEYFSGRQSVEITHQDMKPMLVSLDALE